MLTIVMQPDKSLIVTKSATLYAKEAYADTIRFLVPSQYTENGEVVNVADYVVACKIKTASGKVWVEKLEAEPLPYKDRLDYRMPCDTDFTSIAGTNELYLTFLKAVQQSDGSTREFVLHSGSAFIPINPKEEFVFIPDKTLQAVDQLMLELDDKLNKVNDMVVQNNSDKADDIEIINGEIWLVKTDPETGEKIPIGDPISGTSHVWQEM